MMVNFFVVVFGTLQIIYLVKEEVDPVKFGEYGNLNQMVLTDFLILIILLSADKNIEKNISIWTENNGNFEQISVSISKTKYDYRNHKFLI